MRGLAVSKHIGIRDMQFQLEKLGHQLDVHSSSAHNRHMGWKAYPMDWDMHQVFDPGYCENWWDAHPDKHGYDFYVSFYNPADILLFRPAGKPLVMVCPIRFDEGDLAGGYSWRVPIERRDEYLRMLEGVQVVANSRWDWAFCHEYGVKSLYIPSLCDYTGEVWTGTDPDWVMDWRASPESEVPGTVPVISLQKHTWAEMYAHAGYVEMDPRNVSTMSFYERYAAGMPMAYPDVALLRKMRGARLALDELHFAGVDDRPYVDEALADYYVRPGIPTFRNPDELMGIIESDPRPIHEAIKKGFEDIRRDALLDWGRVLAGIVG